MPFPAYEGQGFYFSIPVGGIWRQEFRGLDRDAAGGAVTSLTQWTGFTATMDITDDSGTALATLSTAGGTDGTITLGDASDPGLVVCELPSSITGGLPPTTSLRAGTTKAFVHAVLWMTDPDHPTEPYPFAVGKGVITNL